MRAGRTFREQYPPAGHRNRPKETCIAIKKHDRLSKPLAPQIYMREYSAQSLFELLIFELAHVIRIRSGRPARFCVISLIRSRNEQNTRGTQHPPGFVQHLLPPLQVLNHLKRRE